VAKRKQNQGIPGLPVRTFTSTPGEPAPVEYDNEIEKEAAEGATELLPGMTADDDAAPAPSAGNVAPPPGFAPVPISVPLPPDPTELRSAAWAEWIGNNIQMIGAGFVLLFVAAIGYGIWQSHEAGVETQAGAALGKALQAASRPVTGKDEPAPEEPPAPDEAPFATDEAKQTALLNAVTDVRTKHGASPAGTLALLVQGDAQFKLGKLDEAQKSYQDYVSRTAANDALHSVAQLNLARIAESKKDAEGARVAYEKLLADAPHTFLKDEATFSKGRLLEAAGKKQEAAEAFQNVKDVYKESPLARDADQKLTALAAEGFVPASVKAAAAADGGK
jgi:predicted negative regulator of RcsB-dependent stress response